MSEYGNVGENWGSQPIKQPDPMPGMIWYLVSSWDVKIIPVRVLKFTDKTVLVAETNWNGHTYNRRHRRTQEYFPTFGAAKDALMQRCQRDYDRSLDRMSRAKFDLLAAAKLEPPVIVDVLKKS